MAQIGALCNLRLICLQKAPGSFWSILHLSRDLVPPSWARGEVSNPSQMAKILENFEGTQKLVKTMSFAPFYVINRLNYHKNMGFAKKIIKKLTE